MLAHFIFALRTAGIPASITEYLTLLQGMKAQEAAITGALNSLQSTLGSDQGPAAEVTKAQNDWQAFQTFMNSPSIVVPQLEQRRRVTASSPLQTGHVAMTSWGTR